MYILIMVLIKNDIDWNGWGAKTFPLLASAFAVVVVIIEYFMLLENSNEKITITKTKKNCRVINASEHFSTAQQ